MRRRDLMTVLVGAMVGWPLAARAQQKALPVVGLLISSLGTKSAFLQGLSDIGYELGQNVKTAKARLMLGVPDRDFEIARNWWFVDSPLEGDGFETSVPLRQEQVKRRTWSLLRATDGTNPFASATGSV